MNLILRGIACCLLLIPTVLWADPSGPDGETARRHGLIRILQEEKIDFEERFLGSYGGSSSSVFVWISGGVEAEPDDRRAPFILAIPLSLPSDEDGALPFRFEAGLWYIRKSRAGPPTIPLLVAFLGDENVPEEGAEELHPGLEDLYSSLDDPENSPLAYLALASPPGKVRIHHGSAGYTSPLNLLQPLTDLFTEQGFPYTVGIRHSGLYRLRLAQGLPALGFIQSRDIPALALTTVEDTKDAPVKSAEEMGEFLAEYGAGVNFSFERADTHYALFVTGAKTGFLSEEATVLLVFFLGGLFLALFLGYTIIFRRRIRLLWGRGILFFWMGPLLFGLLLFCCMGMGLLLIRILGAFSVPLSRVRFGGAALVMLNGGLLFSLTRLFLDRLPIKGKAGFYGNIAAITIAIGLLGGIFLEISLGPALLWILLWTFLGSIVKQPLGVLFCALLSLVTPATILRDSSETGRFMTILQPRYALFFLGFTALILPCCLLLIRGVLLYRRQRRRYPRWQRRILPRLILLILAVAGLVCYGYGLSATPSFR